MLRGSKEFASVAEPAMAPPMPFSQPELVTAGQFLEGLLE